MERQGRSHNPSELDRLVRPIQPSKRRKKVSASSSLAIRVCPVAASRRDPARRMVHSQVWDVGKDPLQAVDISSRHGKLQGGENGRSGRAGIRPTRTQKGHPCWRSVFMPPPTSRPCSAARAVGTCRAYSDHGWSAVIAQVGKRPTRL